MTTDTAAIKDITDVKSDSNQMRSWDHRNRKLIVPVEYIYGLVFSLGFIILLWATYTVVLL